jgi:hypothetical protein
VRVLLCGMLAALAGFHPRDAKGADPDFGYVYTSEIEEPGETEISLWTTDRRGKGEGHYDAQDYRLEVERGITDRFQASAYIDLASHHVWGVAGLDPVHRNFAFNGLEAEFKYRVLNPDEDGVGLAFYAEPGWSRINKVTGEQAREFELELKAIVQKDFLDHRLVWATNLTFEPEWERDEEARGAAEIERELAIEVASGVTYRVAAHWWLGAEGRYHSVYPDWTHGLHRENYAIYVGPTVHYAPGKWSVTASWLPQLVGRPAVTGGSLEFDDHEKRELRLKISREF